MALVIPPPEAPPPGPNVVELPEPAPPVAEAPEPAPDQLFTDVLVETY